jgi:hypothetical protein
MPIQLFVRKRMGRELKQQRFQPRVITDERDNVRKDAGQVSG